MIRHRKRYCLLLLGLFLMATPALSAQRIVAIGDLHGDLEAARAALRLAGAIGPDDHWCGGSLVVVQTGDVLDRGDQEQALLDLLLRLQDEAAAAGGAVHLLNGNHELMNARLDFRYVTPGGFADFADTMTISRPDSMLLALPPEQRARAMAFRPGGPYALLLAGQPVVLLLEGNVFAHGGVSPEHLAYGLERLNREVSAWLRGQGEPPEFIHTGRSPTWSRDYSDEADAEDCDQLAAVLAQLGAVRMIVGHTVQDDGIGPRCGGQVWCIDAGLSAHYGGPVEVLEIKGDEVRILR